MKNMDISETQLSWITVELRPISSTVFMLTNNFGAFSPNYFILSFICGLGPPTVSKSSLENIPLFAS